MPNYRIKIMRTRILMVCLGNICRSPLAQGILASKLPPSDFIVDSAGTGHWHVGKKPDVRSIAVALDNNIDISTQKGRQISVADFESYDIIYTMDMSVHKDVLKLAPNNQSKQKVILILNELFPNENIDVPDPYYGSPDGFTSLYNMLDQVCDTIAHKLIKATDLK